MNTKHVMAAVLLAGASTFCDVSKAESTIEIGELANYFVADDSRDLTKNGIGLAFDAIRLWNSHEGISARISVANLESDLPLEADFLRYTGTVGYWRYLDGDGFSLPGFRPYVNGGIGYGIQNSGAGGGQDDSGLLLEAAFGLVSTWDLLIPNMKLRPEARLDYEDVYGGTVNWTVGLGVHFTFGAPPPAPAALAPAPAPAPAPRAAEPARAPTASMPLADSDEDGVYDADEACAGTTRGTAVDLRGCVRIEKVVGVKFDSNLSTLKPETFGELRDVAAAIKANPGLKVHVGGYCDSTGGHQHNQALSEQRALAVKRFLVQEGVAGDGISTQGYGETKPVDTNDTAEGRANNRRVEFDVLH